MARQWVKETLRKDRLSVFIEKLVRWVIENKESAAISGVIILGIAIFIPFALSRKAKVNEQAFLFFGQAQHLYNSGKAEKAISILNRIAKEYSHTKAAPLALYQKGNISYSSKKFEDAIETYKKCISKYKNNKFIPTIFLALGKSLEEDGKFTEAKEIYKNFIEKNSAHYLLPDAYLGLGRAHEKLGEKEDAVEIYKKTASIYAGTAWKDIAEARIRQISKK